MTKITVLVGLSGSGKSYYAEKLAKENNALIISSDDIRKEVYGDAAVQKDHAKIFEIVHERALEYLRDGVSVIIDATNLSYKFRTSFVQKVNRLRKTDDVDVIKEVYVVATPIEECVSNNLKRDRNVPEEVIWGMAKRFQVPTLYEGWDKIGILWNYRNIANYSVTEEIYRLKTFQQDNENHEFTLGEHMHVASEHVGGHGDVSWVLHLATLLHDIGKPETKTFRTMSGVETENAHYYGHEHVGSYKALFFAKNTRYADDDILKISQLIRFHMRPYFAKSHKAEGKLRRQIGEELYELLLELHEADVSAH